MPVFEVGEYLMSLCLGLWSFWGVIPFYVFMFGVGEYPVSYSCTWHCSLLVFGVESYEFGLDIVW